MATMRCAPSLRAAAPKVAPRVSRSAMVCRADAGFIGSTTNLIMVASTGACLTAARLGFAPTVKKSATAGLKLVEKPAGAVGLMTNDPAGFTVVDTLAMGAAGHVIGVGIVMGLKGIGAL